MGKVLEFNPQKLVRKRKPMPYGEMTGKVIEFRKQKSVDLSANGGTGKADEEIAQALLFLWSF